MEQSFWAGRWEEGMTGFHEGRVNPNLAKYFERVGAGSDAHVLVPLCGKAVDVMWLAERVGRVTGVEFVEQAVLEFFAAQDKGHGFGNGRPPATCSRLRFLVMPSAWSKSTIQPTTN